MQPPIVRESGCEEVLLRRVAEGTPFLGICLGLQLLADVGYEDGEWAGTRTGARAPASDCR